jgi:signal transduction histidine kinase
MSLIPPGGQARHHGGISETTDRGTGPNGQAGGQPHWHGPPWRHAHRWQPPEWSNDMDFSSYRAPGRRRHWMRGFRWRALRRSPNNRVLGGVCGALSRMTGIDVTIIRIGTVVLAVSTVAVIFVYALAWLVVPMENEESTIFSRAIADRRGLRIVFALVPLMIAVEIVVSILHLSLFGLLSVPVFLAAGIGIMIFRNAGDSEKTWINTVLVPMVGGHTGRSRWNLLLRIGGGVALGVGGIFVLISGHTTVTALRPVGGAALVLAAFVVTFGPWWLSLLKDLVSERQARAVAEERAEMAAHVHDSVLQTLALIQRSSDDPQHVVRLARAQERELRAWLFEGRAPGAISGDVSTLAEGVSLVQRLVEADHGITVQVVVVGDCALDDALRALLDAAKEATVNAAKWSGADQVSVFAEVESNTVTLFVRDRGQGFDPATVPADRQGIAQSIRARVARFGGSVDIRSAPGEGAEVALSMPRRQLVQ